jgi:hypothetical protein
MKKRTALVFMVCTFLGLGLSGGAVFGEETFSQDRAFDHLRYIAGTIGPRPLGSPQEKAALTYFAAKLAEYGCQVEWQPVTQAKEMMGSESLNTSSFNVIGRLPGRSEREIVIGAHIDSATPEIPGADDDGSGVATILELARILGQAPHQSTLVFVAFCGEEAGLVGSKEFAEKYTLKNVAMMLELDMTSGELPLMLWIDTKKQQSPKWLVSASIEAYHSLGYRNIDYPTIFQSLNSALGGAGSDHEPFLEKGIPAIAFVSDVRFPIHTRHDSLEYFKASGLARSGRLILELVDKYDGGVPSQKVGHYMLIMLGERPLYISLCFLAAFALLSLVLGAAVLLRLFWTRKAGVNWEEDKKIKKSWPKLVILQLIMLLAAFSSLWVMQLVTGYRLPWHLHTGLHILFAFFFFILGIWLSLQILRRWRLRKNPFFYFVRANAYFAILIVLAWILAGTRLAFFPAAGLLLISLACLVPWTWLKGLLWIMAPYLMFRLLVLPEYHQFVYGVISSEAFAAAKTALAFLIINLGLILFIALWSMPFLLGFAAVHRTSTSDLFGLKSFRRPIFIVPIGILIIGGAVYLKTVPSYTSTWEQEVTVTPRIDAEKNTTWIELQSPDYLGGITANIAGKDEIVNTRSCYKKIDVPLEMNWLKEEVTSSAEDKGPDRMIDLKLRLLLDRQPYTVSLKIQSDKPFQIEEANVKYNHKKKIATVNWLNFPAMSLEPKMKILSPKGSRLDAEISAIFLETPLPLTCQGQRKSFIYRSKLSKKVSLLNP